MANLASGDWTVSFKNGKAADVSITNRKKYINLKLALASGKSMPGAGLALPSKGSAGMVRYLDQYILAQGPIDPAVFTTGATSATDALIWAINTTGNTIHAYRPISASGSGITYKKLVSGDGNIKAHTFYVLAVGW